MDNGFASLEDLEAAAANGTEVSRPLHNEAKLQELALHAAELGFVHPVSGAALHWSMPLPADLEAFLERLRGKVKPVGADDGDQVD